MQAEAAHAYVHLPSILVLLQQAGNRYQLAVNLSESEGVDEGFAKLYHIIVSM